MDKGGMIEWMGEWIGWLHKNRYNMRIRRDVRVYLACVCNSPKRHRRHIHSACTKLLTACCVCCERMGYCRGEPED